jgi:F0F1-type ATP synthase membrane subunit c/vacuolar-type H+-ATPase subunit K
MEFASILAAGGSALDTSAAAALGIGLTGLGAALGQGRAVAAALEGSTRNPGTLASARGTMVLGLGMIESVLVLVVVFLMTKMWASATIRFARRPAGFFPVKLALGMGSIFLDASFVTSSDAELLRKCLWNRSPPTWPERLLGSPFFSPLDKTFDRLTDWRGVTW